MPTTDDAVTIPETRSCPLCGATLDPANPTECPRCDWVPGAPESDDEEPRAGSPRDLAAMIMSVVPGLGHAYKGHKLTGAILLAGTVLIAFFVAATVSYALALPLLLIPIYWGGVMLHAYCVDDRTLEKE